MNNRERLVHLLLYCVQAFAVSSVLFGLAAVVMAVRSGTLSYRLFGIAGIFISWPIIFRSARQRHAGVSRLFGTRPDPLGPYRESKGP